MADNPAVQRTATTGAKFARHTLIDNLQGQVFAVLLVSLGLAMLHSLGLITGQMAGLAFLISYTTGLKFAWVFSVINIPFYVLSLMRMGVKFTLNTIVCVTAMSFLTNYFSDHITFHFESALLGSVLAGICAGVAILMLFRHKASMGGIGILAIYIQEKTGFKAGWLQLIFDVTLFVVAFFFLDFKTVIYSLIGAIVLNFLIAWNHRKEWYVAK